MHPACLLRKPAMSSMGHGVYRCEAKTCLQSNTARPRVFPEVHVRRLAGNQDCAYTCERVDL